MIVSFVEAASENNVIGKNNGLLWHLPNDMAFFKNTTWGMPVIMGRKTFESMQKPLRGRTNIIVSRKGMEQKSGGVLVVQGVDEAIEKADDTDAKECFVIGGGEIYRLFLPRADRIYLTRVHATFEGDAYFPDFDEKEWQLKDELPFQPDNKHAYAYTIQTWVRKK